MSDGRSAPMTREEVGDVLDRVRTWSEDQQVEAAFLLLLLEERRKGVYELSQEEEAELDEADRQIERGEFATDEEMKALFDRYRNA
jgi:predicted transcriptional regulator